MWDFPPVRETYGSKIFNMEKIMGKWKEFVERLEQDLSLNIELNSLYVIKSVALLLSKKLILDYKNLKFKYLIDYIVIDFWFI